VAFYSFVENFNIEHVDVWMRFFVQSLYGEVRKWFHGLTPYFITSIEALDKDFLKQWGDRRDYLYYITTFWDLRRKSGESVSNFIKRFNKMYNKIPDEINPTEALAKIIFGNSFDA
jgi:hypothetical protein